jgi:transposase, IS5 family
MRSLPLQSTFADLELQFQGVHLDPILRAISEFLDRNLTLIEQVRKDLERGLKNARTGRNGIAPSQALRSLVLMRVKNWDYRELQERINDGFTLRSFTGFDSQPVPKHDAFNRAFNRLTPQTPPTPPCCGTQCAPSPASSKTSTRNFPTEYRTLPTAPAALAAACRRSNA